MALMRVLQMTCVLAVFAFLGGCAVMHEPQVEALPMSPENRVADGDYLKPFNQAVFAFNRHFDGAVARPIAKSYELLVSQAVRNGISNFFSNLHDLPSAANSLLQGEARDAAVDLGRLGVNSTIGIGGLADRASGLGLEQHKRDFGQTMAIWGLPSGPYLILPVLGPGTVRSHLGSVVDFLIYPLVFLFDPPTERALLATEFVSVRAGALGTVRLVESLGVDDDGYGVLRSAYLQHRNAKIRGDNAVDDSAYEDLYGQ